MESFGLMTSISTLLFWICCKYVLATGNDCDQSITSNGTVFSSPNYPQRYSNNLACTYNIRAPNGYKVNLTFRALDVEESFGCVFDALTVYDGNSESADEIALICGSSIPSPLYSSGRKMFVTFITDGQDKGTGFEASVTFVSEVPPESPCPSTLVTESGGTFLSPNYPGLYSHNQTCLYRAVAPSDLTVALDFIEFSIEHHPGCIYDQILVYDGPNEFSPILTIVCGTGIPNTIYSTGNTMLVAFQTDESVASAGFQGVFTFVETADGDSSICEYTPCLNHGSCDDLGDGNYECHCPNNVIGNNCEFDYSDLECSSGPCMNGGSCYNLQIDVCVCQPDYTGRYCEFHMSDIKNECTAFTNPCNNGGQCTAIWDTYFCNCLEGFTGEHCEFEITSDSFPCNDVVCTNLGRCILISGEPVCHCHESESTDIECETTLDDCSSNPCEYGSTCTDTPDGFVCTCVTGFTGALCTEELNECSPNPCSNNGACIEITGGYTCFCPAGFSGSDCSIDVNECSSSLCQNGGSCINYSGGFYCACALGFSGTLCSIELNECSSNPCLNNGVCTDITGGYICNCLAGFSGSDCSIELNECSSNPCLNNGVCMDITGGYICNCLAGFLGLDCSIDFNECWSDPCRNDGTCVDDINSFVCYCKDGFDGFDCSEDTNLCDPNPCVNGDCAISNGDVNVECTCTSGWKGDYCDEETTPCEEEPCENGGFCLTGSNTDFVCRCPSTHSGQYCETDNPNDCTNNPCENGGECLFIAGDVICVCQEGFSGQYCDTDLNANFCDSNPCLNSGSCFQVTTSLSTPFVCVCETGYSGTYCEIDESQPCAHDPCENGGSCFMNQNTFICVCSVGYEGDRCEIDITSPCFSVVCFNDGTCYEHNENYFCVCHGDFTGATCENLIDACDTMPCQNGDCSTVNGVAVCSCQAGWEGDMCTQDIDECQDDPCINANCQNNEGSYVCNCLTGYSGQNCQTKDATDMPPDALAVSDIGLISGIAGVGVLLLIVMLVGFAVISTKLIRNTNGQRETAVPVSNPAYTGEQYETPTAGPNKVGSPTYQQYLEPNEKPVYMEADSGSYMNAYDVRSPPSRLAPSPPAMALPPTPTTPPPQYTYIDTRNQEDDYMYLDPGM